MTPTETRGALRASFDAFARRDGAAMASMYAENAPSNFRLPAA